MKLRPKLAILLCVGALFVSATGCGVSKQGSAATTVQTTAAATAGKTTLATAVTTQAALDNMANVDSASEAASIINNNFGDCYYAHLTTADTIYWIDRDNLTDAECNMLLSLQGIVAQEKSEIFLLSKLNKVWMDALKEYYGIKFVEIKSPWDMVLKFKDRLKDNGFVRYTQYDPSKVYLWNPNAPSSVNTATVISGVERYLMVEDSLVSKAQEIGLVQRADGNDYDQIEVFEHYQGQLNKDVFTSLAYTGTNLRDMAVALKTMVWRDDDLDDLSLMLSQMNPNGVVLGWHNDEGTGIQASTLQAYGTVFSFISDNVTVYAGLPKQALQPNPYTKYEVTDGTKVHYVAFIQSDGDALSIVDRNFSNEYDFFPDKDRGSIPYGWSITPSLADFSPLFAKYFYSKATSNDSFVAALGASYIHPDIYPSAQLGEYAKRTSDYMKAMGLRYTTLLESNDGSADKAAMQDQLAKFAQYDGIQGGFLQYAAEGYLSTKNPGAIYWSNGKPFLNYRESLAAPGWGADPSVYYDMSEIVEKMAYRINHYKKDPSVIEGYTLVNVHPWSAGYNYAVELAGLLDDDVVVVSPNELMDLIRKNVAETDVMQLNDVSTFDYSNMETYAKRKYIPLDDIKLKKATTRLSYDFNTGMQGWVPIAGETPLDSVFLQNLSGSNYGIKLSGNGNVSYTDKVDASLYNKITLPQQSSLTMTISAFVYPKTKIRVQVLDENQKLHTVYDWTEWTSTTAHSYDVNLSAYAGRTVTISVQYYDSSRTGSMTMVDSIDIH